MKDSLTLQLLKQVPLFAELEREDLELVADLVKRAEFPAGSEICRQGKVGLTAYIVASGELCVLHVDPQGVEREVDRMGEGAFFGETSLLLGEPRDATVEVVQDASLLYLNKEDFDQLLHDHPKLLKRLQMSRDVARKRRAPRFKWQDPDEVVVIRLHKHNAVLWQQLAFPALVLMVGLAALGYWLGHREAALALVPGVFLTMVALPLALYLIADHLNDDYILTNKRVVDEERVLFVKESRTEAPLYTVEDIQESQQGMLAQFFNFSTLIIETAGERGHVVFRQIPNPEETRDAIFEQIARIKARARAEERAAIRDSMHRHFGIESAAEAAPPPPEKKRRFRLTLPRWVTAPVRLVRFFMPRLRYEQGETITWRKHWVALIKPVGPPSLLIAGITVAAVWILSAGLGETAPVLIAYGTALVLLLPWWIWQFDDWQNDIYQVTATRIIDIERLPFYLREQRREASLDKIQNTNLEIPGVLAKLLNYGSVTIETAGTEPFTFDLVKDPRGVQSEISRRVEAYRQQLSREEAKRHRSELLDWFSVYDQVRHSPAPPDQAQPPPPQEEEA